MSKHPEVLWAQRSSGSVPEENTLYLTINLPDIVEQSLEYALTSTSLSFKATAGVGNEQSHYAFGLDFFAEVEPEKSTKRLTSRSLFVVLRKKETKIDYWPRLTKEKIRTPYIKTDFGRWVDEDEQDGKPNPHDEDFDFGGGGGGGFPGMGMDNDFDLSKMADLRGGGSTAEAPAARNDSDEEDGDGPPPLEDAEPVK